MGKEFTTAKNRHKPIEFTLDGEDYVFTPPKLARMTADLFGFGDDDEAQDGVAKAAMDWLSDGLPEEQRERIISRLRDPDDDFDVPDLTDIIKWLVSKVSGRPSTSRRG